MIRTVTCVTVICDRCKESAGAQDDEAIGEIHFTSPAEAAEHLPGWRLDPVRGQAVCPGCLVDEECATRGHDLDEWRDCACRGGNTAHRAEMTVDAILTSTCPLRVRRCQRCHHYSETDPPLPEPTVDLDEFVRALVDGELAPAGAVTATVTAARPVVVTVDLAAGDPHKARWLTNWLRLLMAPVAMTVARDDANDDLVCLTISGALQVSPATDGIAIVTAAFSATAEPAQVATILAATVDHDQAGDCGQELTELVEQLTTLTTHEEA